MKYRPEIDGLRALAVVPVVLFHAGFDIFAGGYIGVDVFFVISGYLITTILIDDLDAGRFSLLSFYERRARRILPALFLVMLVCIPFAWILMLPEQMQEFFESLVAVPLFVSNILFLRQSGYFETDAEEKPLLHTWSLAVEEQYYVVFPIFLFFAWRFGRNRVFWTVSAIAVFSLALSEWGWRVRPNGNFFLAPTRAWELLAGSLAAISLHKTSVQSNNLLAALGLSLILVAMFGFDAETPIPSLLALIPVTGVVLIILFAGPATWVAKLLSNRVFVAIGLLSYSMYLWHQPLFAYGKLAMTDGPDPWVMGLLIACSFCLAFLSWKYVETPFRNKSKVSGRAMVLSTSSLAVLFIAVGVAGQTNRDQIETFWLTRQSETVQESYRILSKVDPATSNFGADAEGKQDLGPCRFNVRALTDVIEDRLRNCRITHGPGILVLGDSHAIDLFGVLASRFDTAFLVGVTRGGCRPHANHDYCHYDRVSDFIGNHPDMFSRVLYEQAGFYLLRDAKGRPGSRDMFADLGLTQTVDGITIDTQNIDKTLAYLTALSRIVPVGWVLPRYEPHVPEKSILKRGCQHEFLPRPKQLETFLALDDHIEARVSETRTEDVSVIRQNALFAFDFPADFMTCDALYWSDGDHYSTAGEIRFGQRLPDTFLDALDRPTGD